MCNPFRAVTVSMLVHTNMHLFEFVSNPHICICVCVKLLPLSKSRRREKITPPSHCFKCYNPVFRLNSVKDCFETTLNSVSFFFSPPPTTNTSLCVMCIKLNKLMDLFHWNTPGTNFTSKNKYLVTVIKNVNVIAFAKCVILLKCSDMRGKHKEA